MKAKRIGITGRKENRLAKETAQIFIGMMEDKKAKIETDKAFLGKGKELNRINCDLLICFGGDGTLLMTFRELKKEIPVLGINCGNAGFLHAYQHTEIGEAVADIASGKIEVEKRSRISAKVDGKKAGEGLNEILIVPGVPGRIVKHRLLIGDDETREAGDGLIVATPTGSTAHALSAGGPMVKGNADVFVVVPINPVDWKHRPLIINDHEKVIIDGFRKVKAKLIIDGQKRFNVRKRIELAKGKEVLLATKP